MTRQSDKKNGSRIAELEKELKIEAALERVRTVAMGMSSPDDLLGICETMFGELQKLGFDDLRNAMISIHYDEKQYLLNYEYRESVGKTVIKVMYNSHPIVNNLVDHAKQSGEGFTEQVYTGEALEEWRAFRMENGEADDPRLHNISALYYYFYSIGTGAIGISAFSAANPEQLNVLKRFRNVFDLAYKRYIDITNAAAQAREAQIELGLERVRARAMAMQNSDELAQLVTTLFNELSKLHFTLARCFIWIIDTDTLSATTWMANPGVEASSYQWKYFDHPYYKGIIKAWKERNPKWAYELKGKEKLVLDDIIFNLPSLKDTPEVVKAAMRAADKAVLSFSFSNFGGLQIDGPEPLSEDNHDILSRFSKVFDQTYTRFSDLKKAEAQAREGQIELALERVRARTMAMQHSDELAETAYILFRQFRDLGENPDQATIGIINEAEGVIEYWVTLYGSQANRVFKFPIDEPNVTRKIYKAWKKHEKSLVIDLSGKALHDFSKFRESMGGAGYNPDENRRIINVAFFSKGLINVQSTVERSVESLRLLERFANVFESTYTRFLDLKKAEAQAREAQIEAALERVRSRSLAMHKSDELQEVVTVVFKQLQELGISVDGVSICTFIEGSKDIIFWTAVNEQLYTAPIYFPYFDHPVPADFWKAKENGLEFYGKAYTVEEKNNLWEYNFKHTGFKNLPEERKRMILESSGYTFAAAWTKNSAIAVNNFAGKLFSDQDTELLKRFARAFEQAYIRFLDLQRAEAQARDAKIEAALERTRTQSMLMQHSTELDDTLQVFHQQVLSLDIPSAFSFLWLPDENNDRHIFWAAWAENNSAGPSYFQSKAIDYPLDRNEPATAQCLVDWKGSNPVVSYQVSPDGVESYFAAWQELIDGVEHLKPEYFHDGLYYVEAFMKYGCFGVMMKKDLANDEKKILGRFAIEFERTYTRFLDLQRAEEQAREAKIETALEKVRSRSLAMHKTDELQEVVNLVFDKLMEIGVATDSITLSVPNRKARTQKVWIAVNGVPYPNSMFMPYHDDPVNNEGWDAWDNGMDYFAKAYSFEEKNKFFKWAFEHTDLKYMPAERKNWVLQSPAYACSFAFGKISAIWATSHTGKVLSAKDGETLKRFAKVFEQTYTRFLDLQRAEEQAREAQIQLAMERVRARTMAMQKSDELAETVSLLFKQLLGLGIRTEQIRTCGIVTFDDKKPMGEQWITETNGEIIPKSFMVPYDEAPAYKAIYKSWKDGGQFMVIHLEDEKLKEHLGYLARGTNVPTRDVVLPQQATEIYNHVMFFSQGCLFIITKEALPEYHDVFKRFGAVFQQSYTRFLDLKKAEEQAREAQIEAALEKVRSRSLAMHKSDELRDVVKVVFEKLQELSFGIDGAAFIVTPGEIAREVNTWIGDDHADYPSCFKTPFFNAPVITDIFDALESGSDFFSKTYAVNEKNPWFEYAFKHTDYKYLPEELRSWILAQENLTQCFALAKNSGVGIHFHNRRPLSENETDILKRFAKVFEQSYIRFLDLQKAETQAREAKIEAALEKVRARAMAMHQSQDINTAVLAVFEELEKLNLDILRCGIGIIDSENQVGDIWTTVKLDGKSSVQVSGKEPMNIHPLMQGTYDAWLNQTDFLYELTGDDLVAYYRAVAGTNFILPESHSLTDENDGAKQYYYTPTFKTGNLYAFRESPFPDDAKLIMKRFASVLNLTFSRFLDLQKAEAQAREAQIEASLERVRSKAMAMRNSGDLLAAASTVFTELQHLGISQIRSGVGLITKDFHNARVYSATSSQSAVDLSLMGEVTLYGHPVFEQQYQSWLKQENYFVALEGKELVEYYKILSAGLNAKLGVAIKNNQKEYGHWFMFSEGFLYAWSDKEYTDAEIKVLERFKNVMELTIRRYIELQKSELQAREAVRQASLDRVRAEIASMRTIGDLDRITPLIWNELTILGVPFIRCGVFIMDEPAQLIHTYLSTPDGKAIAAFQLHFNSDTGNGVNQTALRGWREKQVVTLHWTEEEFKNFSHALVEQGEIASEKGYLTDRQPGGLDLHFFPFLQGMLYAGNTQPLSDDDKDLVQSLADAFSTAYARYEDFNRLELAKQEVERTLTDLRTAQTRLIQSEKMASLGELTAGIAHEIQNPLNFVNNFSEVNQEMIDELEEELNAGNIEEALAIAADIKQNEQKINHHGKRADGIVKGMLQHSRTAGGEKLPTNINSIAEEYMRLSYHGLRAKDKSFNAEMVMHFDPDLPKIQAVGQDIGRVMLNLFNNAFYAVNLKKKTMGAGYNPEVSVTTTAEDRQIVIKVKDNGVGIPDQVKEKIMQPFFTTKPTGEGTGLGLSLTYDMVVKGHGGSIHVNSVEGESSEFIIQLPIN